MGGNHEALDSARVRATLLVTSGAAPGAGGKGKEPLDMYRATVDAAQAASLTRGGYDVAAKRAAPGGTQVDLVLRARDRDRLASEGVKLELIRNDKGQTVRQQAALQAAAGFTVWRSYDQPGGIRDELYSIAAKNPSFVKLEVIGHTIQGREIVALKVTKNARTVADGSRPSVLYMGTIHAREWISTEVVRRELRYFVDNYKKNSDVTDLVDTRELWFMPVANPDGYQYTFDGERLWRKNLHDNDGDGVITNADGVDLNRNYDINWSYDDEGSSTQVSSETYRGTAPASEPEVKAHQALIDRLKFKFLATYHSYGPLLLYPFGWQIQTRRRTTRCTSPTRVPMHTRRSRASTRTGWSSIRASPPTSTSRTAQPTTTPTPRQERSRGLPSSRRGVQGAGSSSRRTSRRSRRSSSTTCRSRSTWRSPRRIPRTRSRTSGTR
jgi:zinc carboxypeptidase